MMFRLLRYSIPRAMSNMNWIRVCRDRSWGDRKTRVRTRTRQRPRRRQTYEGLLPQPGQQQEGVQVSVLHEGQNHHGDREAPAGAPVEADPWGTDRVNHGADL